MALPRHIEAEVHYLTTEEGGRRTPANSGYRGMLHYDGINVIAFQEFPDAALVKPGGKVRAYVGFLTPAISLHKMYVGKSFLVREGAKIVARGVVTKVFADDGND